MISIALLLFAASQPNIELGGKVFRERCSVPYCHGLGGTAGRAPAVAGKPFDRSKVEEIIEHGKQPGMPAFGKILQRPELDAVVAYVMSISTPSGPKTAAAVEPAKRPQHAIRGHALFFDPVRMGGCGRCHELEEWGVAIGPNLEATRPASGAVLRRPAKSSVVMVEPAGEAAFPAILAERGEVVRVYDLSSRLPVLRTFAPASVKIATSGKWDHAGATAGYSDAELNAIAAYLRWVGER
jgi:mono/diheme cytochrome c family protein